MRLHAFRSAVGVAALGLLPVSAFSAPPKNVILFIGDGMGAEQIKAAGYYFNGGAGQFNFEQLDRFAWMEHNNSSGGVTDSAASATALATGFKVNNDVVSIARASGPDPRSATPSDDRDLRTLLELFKSQGKRTGLVTNSYLNDATPAAFAAHVPDRGNLGPINADYFTQTKPNVLLGGSSQGLSMSTATNNGYSIVTNRAQMQAVDTATASQVISFFGTAQFDFAYDQSVGSTTFYDTNPYLHEMTTTAIDILSRDQDGFFLMVENDLVDSAGHLAVGGAAKHERAIFEVRELSRAVQRALDFAAANPDTLIVVTADHETGGITTGANGGAGVFPTMSSGGTSHNATWVPFYAQGPNAGHVNGLVDNTSLFNIVTRTDSAPVQGATIVKSFRQGMDGFAASRDTQVRADQPDVAFGASPMLLIDTDDDPGNASTSPLPVQAVLRFDDLFSSTGVPEGAQILWAKLSIFTGNEDGDGTAQKLSLHRLLVGFNEDTTWNNAGNAPANGFSLNSAGSADDDYLASSEYVFPAPSNNAIATFDVTMSLAAWLDALRGGGSANFGWLLANAGTDGWRFHSADTTDPLSRPLLEVAYVVPEPIAGVVFAATLLYTRAGRIRPVTSPKPTR